MHMHVLVHKVVDKGVHVSDKTLRIRYAYVTHTLHMQCLEHQRHALETSTRDIHKVVLQTLHV